MDNKTIGILLGVGALFLFMNRTAAAPAAAQAAPAAGTGGAAVPNYTGAVTSLATMLNTLFGGVNAQGQPVQPGTSGAASPAQAQAGLQSLMYPGVDSGGTDTGTVVTNITDTTAGANMDTWAWGSIPS